MTTLPSDLDIARQLTSVRAAVIEATHHVRSPKRSTRYRVTRNLIIAGAAIAALTAGAIIVLQEPPDIVAGNVACYRTASLDDGEPSIIMGEPGLSENAAELCAWWWSNDGWSNESNPESWDPVRGDYPVPPLVACTRSDGIAAVFPNEGDALSDEDFCGALGLADWDSD
jgi:hypothetical protein